MISASIFCAVCRSLPLFRYRRSQCAKRVKTDVIQKNHQTKTFLLELLYGNLSVVRLIAHEAVDYPKQEAQRDVGEVNLILVP